jgi:hypothetical protein
MAHSAARVRIAADGPETGPPRRFGAPLVRPVTPNDVRRRALSRMPVSR